MGGNAVEDEVDELTAELMVEGFAGDQGAELQRCDEGFQHQAGVGVGGTSCRSTARSMMVFIVSSRVLRKSNRTCAQRDSSPLAASARLSAVPTGVFR